LVTHDNRPEETRSILEMHFDWSDVGHGFGAAVGQDDFLERAVASVVCRDDCPQAIKTVHPQIPSSSLRFLANMSADAPEGYRMTRRSRGREVALQLLYQREQNPKIDRAALEDFARERLKDEPIRKFCMVLFDEVTAHLTEIDAKLSAAAENWRIARMPPVDRSILRLGAYELLFMQDTPAAVAFDEAIELARRYGSADSSAFVNGVLDRLRKDNLAAPPTDGAATL
jgi:N utilization substance protein B